MTAPGTITPLKPDGPEPIFMRYVKLEVKGIEGDPNAGFNASFECQVTSAGIASTGGDKVELNTLCPEGSYAENTERTYSFDMTGVQDVTTQDSLMLWLWEHNGETVTLTYYPYVDKAGVIHGRGWRGDVKVSPPDVIGGVESGNYATFTTSLPYQGTPVLIDDQGTEVPPTQVTIVPTGATPGMPGSFEPAGANVANLTALQALGPLGETTAWNAGEYVVLQDSTGATWTGTAWAAYVIPSKAAVAPSNVFPAEATITASDPTNAAKLTGLGYVAASGAVPWTVGQKFTVGTFDFNWSGTAWAAGAHA